MKIGVLVKQVPDTWSERRLDTATGRTIRATGDAVVDEIDEKAIEAALRYADSHDAETILITMGPAAASDALRKGLAMGADSAVHVLDDTLAGSDMVRTAQVLDAAIRSAGCDLVVAGNESTDGRGGAVPAMLAEIWGVPHLTNLDEVEISETSVSGTRSTEYETARVSSALPAVVSITERAAEARFPNLRGILKAKKKPISTLTLADLGVEPAATGLTMLSTTERPPRGRGITVVDEGGTAANALADYLADKRLI